MGFGFWGWDWARWARLIWSCPQSCHDVTPVQATCNDGWSFGWIDTGTIVDRTGGGRAGGGKEGGWTKKNDAEDSAITGNVLVLVGAFSLCGVIMIFACCRPIYHHYHHHKTNKDNERRIKEHISEKYGLAHDDVEAELWKRKSMSGKKVDRHSHMVDLVKELKAGWSAGAKKGKKKRKHDSDTDTDGTSNTGSVSSGSGDVKIVAAPTSTRKSVKDKPKPKAVSDTDVDADGVAVGDVKIQWKNLKPPASDRGSVGGSWNSGGSSRSGSRSRSGVSHSSYSDSRSMSGSGSGSSVSGDQRPKWKNKQGATKPKLPVRKSVQAAKPAQT